MTTKSPIYDIKASYSGFLDFIFQNLPSVFSPDPKPQTALTFTQAPAPLYPYISVKDGFLYVHSLPLETIAFTPEISYDLRNYSLHDLATALSSGTGYTVTATGNQDGTTAAMLLGFTDYTPGTQEITQLQIATSRLWKFLHPIASALQEVGANTDISEDMAYLPFSTGFWADYWGDWLAMPRPTGMTDAQYIGYLLWNMRTPKLGNDALADILSSHFGAPFTVTDTAKHQFTVNTDASLMSTVSTQSMTPIVNKAKAAGTTWTVDYESYLQEVYEAYFISKSHGKTFQNSDVLGLMMPFFEEQYGYRSSGGFLMNQSPMNDADFGFGRTMNDDPIKLSLGFSETKYSSPHEAPSQTITLQQTETYHGKAGDALNAFNVGLWDGFKYRAPVAAFTFNQSPMNDVPMGGGTDNAIKERIVMYYNSPTDPSYTAM